MRKLLFAAVMFLSFFSRGWGGENLVPNGDFELASPENPDMPDGWSYGKRWTEGGQYWVTDTVHSGKKAVKIESVSYKPPAGAAGGGITLSCRQFPAPAANSMIDISAWIKAKDVVSSGGYFKLRFVISFMDGEGKRTMHRDLLATEGSMDWTKIEGRLPVPDNTKTISLMFALTACTGTGWIDDVQVTVHGEPLTKEKVFQEIDRVEGPVIIPQPWQVKNGNGHVEAESLAVKGLNGNPKLQKAVEKWLAEIKLPYSTADNEPAGALLISGDGSEKNIAKRFKETFPQVSWKDLGDQGYFLSVSNAGGKNVIYLGANMEQGRFYGLQTLKQLSEQKGAKTSLRLADIVDRPTMSRRGMAMGLQWFGQRDKAIERLAGLKCNFILNGGSFMTGKFGGHHSKGTWREPFTDGEITLMKDYGKLAADNFIDIAIDFSPRLGEPRIRYSSDEDINIIVAKMSSLYDAGFRSFGLNFDDLQNVGMERLTEREDIATFGNDMGKAHYYFVLEIYNRLKAKHPDISFYMLPLWYGSFPRLSEDKREYLRTVGKLPKEITFVSCAADMENIREAKQLTGRYHLTWDNFFAGFERGGAPVFVPPIERSGEIKDTVSTGYIFLPMIPAKEDAAGTSWMTAADYMWSPERYVPDRSFRRAAARAVGGGRGVSLLEEYYKYTVSDIRKTELPHGEELQTLEMKKTDLPDDSGTQRVKVLQTGISKLKEWKEKLQAVVPEKLFASVNKEIEGNMKNLELLLLQEKEKPFPVKVQKTAGTPQWDRAAELTGFYVMAGNGERAKEQTSARLMYDDKNLYMKVVCRESEMNKILAKETEWDRNVYKDDCVEIFLDANADRKNYFHIIINSLGTVYDGTNFDKSWNGSYTITPVKGPDSWTLDITIPFKTLGITAVKPGDRWNFNVCRERYASQPEFSSYALLVKPGFHATDRFWTLEFE